MSPTGILAAVSAWAIPTLILLVVAAGAMRRVKVYESFVEGAREGFEVAVRIIPYLVAILVAVGMLRASGAVEALVGAVGGLTSAIGLPAEVLPVALLRPLSGSGTLGLVSELSKVHGPDSFVGRLSATMYGSTETTFYVLAVYFGAVGITRSRHAVLAGLAGDLAGLVAALLVCRWLFG